jgi:hypothetical protein
LEDEMGDQQLTATECAAGEAEIEARLQAALQGIRTVIEAEIVAWLRSGRTGSEEWPFPHRDLADAIERGDHRQSKGTT